MTNPNASGPLNLDNTDDLRILPPGEPLVLETLHDQYTMAALTGLLDVGGLPTALIECEKRGETVEHFYVSMARAIADECILQRQEATKP